ncbi:uncharacterized protein J4E87_001900 [Alternaria ethzedia]|uniref:uncharacterized protein n=1 Tax=Alternaria ethzedia TaxID=181014 RepID=UPI0020C1CE60|nr:uncharacterized protein J4E87_001900 [Alternaria ethzedia]KAI4632427.1 hypothetical protein J4E87_001900 [Alternaria ethzedia]
MRVLLVQISRHQQNLPKAPKAGRSSILTRLFYNNIATSLIATMMESSGHRIHLLASIVSDLVSFCP